MLVSSEGGGDTLILHNHEGNTVNESPRFIVPFVEHIESLKVEVLSDFRDRSSRVIFKLPKQSLGILPMFYSGKRIPDLEQYAAGGQEPIIIDLDLLR